MFSASSKISPKEQFKILALARIKGVGLRVFERLMQNFGSLEDVFAATCKKLQKIVSYPIARVITSGECLDEADSYMRDLDKRGIKFLTILEKEYPRLLREIPNPPLLLYYEGDFKVEDFGRCLAVVGTRNCTRYGERIACQIVEKIVEAGFTVVSGMAFGIDRISHEAAIASSGRTIAVLSGRVDIPSPRSNFKIYKKILKSGCILSEVHLDQEIVGGMFPSRNRIISGLSLGTLVIEAGAKSGALITARHALEQGREVFAVPASFFVEKGKGTNNLIKRGEAKLVQGVDDILEEFGFKVENKGRREEVLTPMEREIVDFLVRGPAPLDEISLSLDIEISRLSQIVTMMELSGKVAKTDEDEYVVVK